MALTPFRPFDLEAWQSAYEMEVDFNLADSGVQPVGLQDLLREASDTARDRFLTADLHYPAVNGTDRLRDAIAALYQTGTGRQNVLVTVGAAEANGLVVTTLTEPGDHVVVLEPGYRQVAGVAENRGCEVEAVHLVEERGWRLDLEELERVVRPDTRLIAMNNPNNPTGAVMNDEERAAVLAAAARVGAWLLVDEVYTGSEVSGLETPSFVGTYDRIVTTNSLSKAYGLSGLRVGWTVTDESTMQALWRRHEYATISTSNLSMLLAEIAVQSPTRTALFERNRTLVRDGFARIQRWADALSGIVSVVRPEATALAFPRFNLPMSSLEVAHALRRAGVLVGVGSHFGVDHHLRITHALEGTYMDAALERMGTVFSELAHTARV